MFEYSSTAPALAVCPLAAMMVLRLFTCKVAPRHIAFSSDHKHRSSYASRAGMAWPRSLPSRLRHLSCTPSLHYYCTCVRPRLNFAFLLLKVVSNVDFDRYVLHFVGTMTLVPCYGALRQVLDVGEVRGLFPRIGRAGVNLSGELAAKCREMLNKLNS